MAAVKLNVFKYSALQKTMNVKINGYHVWKERVHDQAALLRILAYKFRVDLTHNSFSFYPNTVYFATPLTTDPKYTKLTRPVWVSIKKLLSKFNWDVYAPFDKTDPHSIVPDGLTAYEITELDHVQVLTKEVGLFDLNRPSHGSGQEFELGLVSSIPRIGFSKEKISRMIKGSPGALILNYKTEKELVILLKKVFERGSYKKEPFYVAKCKEHPMHSVFKGKICLNCFLKDHLHPF